MAMALGDVVAYVPEVAGLAGEDVRDAFARVPFQERAQGGFPELVKDVCRTLKERFDPQGLLGTTRLG